MKVIFSWRSHVWKRKWHHKRKKMPRHYPTRAWDNKAFVRNLFKELTQTNTVGNLWTKKTITTIWRWIIFSDFTKANKQRKPKINYLVSCLPHSSDMGWLLRRRPKVQLFVKSFIYKLTVLENGSKSSLFNRSIWRQLVTNLLTTHLVFYEHLWNC